MSILSLTNNIDTYPSWNNELHKKIKLDQYENNLNERLVNMQLTKELTDDFRNRYFPDKIKGIPTLDTVLEERKLYEKLNTPSNLPGIYTQNPYIEPEIIVNNLITQPQRVTLESHINPETTTQSISKHKSKLGKSLTSIKTEKRASTNNIDDRILVNQTLSEIINTAEKEIKKSEIYKNSAEYKEAKRQFNAEQELKYYNIEAEKELKPKERQALTSQEEHKHHYVPSETTQFSSMIPGTSIIGEYGPTLSEEEERLSKKESFLKSKPDNEKIQILTDLYKQTKQPLTNKGSKYVTTFQIVDKKPIFYQFNMEGKLIKQLTPSEIKSKLDGFLIENKNKYISASKDPEQAKIEYETMHGYGLKKKSPSKRASPGIRTLKNRFNILKGEIMNGNTNKEVQNELKEVIKKLKEVGYL